MAMMKRESFPIADIYVPVKRRATLKPQVVQEIAASMLEVGQQTPIMVRQEDGGRLVLSLIQWPEGAKWGDQQSPRAGWG